MYSKISLDMLTRESVSVVKQTFIDIEGQQHVVGTPHRRAFINSAQGRNELQQALNEEDILQDDYDAIIAKWGDTPTIIEPELPIGGSE